MCWRPEDQFGLQPAGRRPFAPCGGGFGRRAPPPETKMALEGRSSGFADGAEVGALMGWWFFWELEAHSCAESCQRPSLNFGLCRAEGEGEDAAAEWHLSALLWVGAIKHEQTRGFCGRQTPSSPSLASVKNRLGRLHLQAASRYSSAPTLRLWQELLTVSWNRWFFPGSGPFPTSGRSPP